MSIASSEKIFIDNKDEITFVVERMLDAEKNRVIIVVPQNSLLLSSVVSIEILFRKLVKSKKVAVIVTEDEYGRTIATKAGFVVVSKVSQINNDIWELAISNIQTAKDELAARKKELLSNITGEQGSLESEVPSPEEVPGADFEMTEKELESEPEEYAQTTEKVQPEVVLPTEIEKSEVPSPKSQIEEVEEAEDKSKEKTEVKAETEEKEDAELDKELAKYQKPRREAKVVNIGGIEILSGGDIKNYIENSESDKMDDDYLSELSMNSEDGVKPRKIKTVTKGNFTGRDFTKAVSNESKIKLFFSKIFRPRRVIEPQDKFEGTKAQDPNRKKLLLIFLAVVLMLFLAGTYVLAFRASSVDVVLTVKKQDVSTSANIIVSPAATAVSYDPITIPGKIISIDPANMSESKTGSADGNGLKGDKAKGVVRIINSTTDPVTLKAGTKLTSQTTQLVYLLSQDTSIDAGTAHGAVIDASIKEDVAVEAADIGDKYNIPDTVTGTKFTIEGYDTSKMTASQYLPFSGGTQTSFISVSQDNFDNLKKTIEPDLKNQALARLKTMIDPGYKLVDGSVIYDESKDPVSIPKVGDEAPDKTFTLTLQIGISGLEVKSNDLVSAVTYILQNTKGTDPSTKFDVADVNDPNIDKVDKNGDNYVLTISSQGSVRTQVTTDQMKNDIKGLTIDQAKDYFHFIDYIQDYKVTFNPGIVPDFLKRVPTDISRINITLK